MVKYSVCIAEVLCSSLGVIRYRMTLNKLLMAACLKSQKTITILTMWRDRPAGVCREEREGSTKIDRYLFEIESKVFISEQLTFQCVLTTQLKF